ncbi:O-antigen ligase family protein [Halomonas sp. H33-56]|uniref:O-antigen ligase family protein n=1 Tax=Halomonas sp. H33-56 TaxID=2950873 RepID=UPI0032DEE4F5
MKKYYFLLAIALFPVFGVEVVDKTGLTDMPLLSANKIVRLLWFFSTTVVFIALIKLGSRAVFTKSHRQWLLVSFLLILSVGLNTPQSVVAWYRVAEIIVPLAVIVFVVNKSVEYNVPVEILLHKAVYFIAATSLIVVFLYLILDQDMVWVKETQGRTRLGGYVYSPNMLGAFMSFGFVSALSLSKTERNNTIKSVFYIMSAIAFVSALIFTGSRTSLALLFLLILIHTHIYMKKRFLLFEKTILFLAAIIVGFCALIYLMLNIMELIEVVGKGEDPIREIFTLNNRTVVFSTALHALIENPLTGVGYVVGVEDYYAENFPQRFWLPPHTHNGVLEILMALGGVFGLILLLYILKNLLLHFGRIVLLKNGGGAVSTYYVVVFALSMTTVPFGNVYGPLCGIFWMTFVLTNKV